MNCEATITQTPGPFGFVPVTCGQSVGIRTWRDATGQVHGACFRHIAERLHRFPEGDAPEYADDMTFAKWERERYESWTEAS